MEHRLEIQKTVKKVQGLSDKCQALERCGETLPITPCVDSPAKEEKELGWFFVPVRPFEQGQDSGVLISRTAECRGNGIRDPSWQESGVTSHENHGRSRRVSQATENYL